MFEGVTVDALVGEIADSVRGESVLLARRCAAIAALLAVRTAEAEAADPDPGWSMITGFARTTAEVSAAMNMTARGAQHLVAQAEALDVRLPKVAALLAAGGTDWRTVEQVIKRTELVDDAQCMATLDSGLAERIGSWLCWSRQRISNAVDAAVRAADPAAAKERRVRAHDERFVHVSAGPDGTAVLRAKLPAPVAAIVDKQLAQMAKSVCGKDPRTMDQRRSDALWALAERRELTCACGQSDCPARTQDPQRPAGSVSLVINVIATEDTVAGDSDQPGYLEGYGVIDAEQVRELAETAVIRPVECPEVSAEQAHRYQPSAGLENWIRCRDLTCRFPGCDRKAWICDIDHTVAFNHNDPAAGGLTVADDLSCECREHHRLKTIHGGPGGWRDTQLPDGRIEWTSPTGRTYTTSPLGYDLFPQLRQACRAPTGRKRSRAKELAARIGRARAHLHQQRPVNAENRRVNYARRREIELRKWRNQSRRYLILFKGEQHSTSPWCTWLNEPFEPEELPPDWKPPPPTPTTDNDDPPF
ncbi:HNH nuclease [Mycobacterium sp. ACS1612]|uniref:HNH endonuclease signature motif containing protein n=1 Tax=Mycobacterium sp. ACS1612 TaxID=1834117 RepID=UPI0007FD6352|nr:HNH endonuclease signature motif containing protein [Mycobacterium sp. ACS1612]OBF37259.1 HNH nuclease [Mycobacterium sp. ACS1612]